MAQRQDKYDISIKPPLAGVVRNTSHQTQAPFSCYSSLNMWPVDHLTGRYNYATRPPLVAISGAPSGFCTTIIPVNGVVTDQPTQSFLASFGGNLYWWNGTGFTAATGAQAGAGPTTRAGYGAAYLSKAFVCVDSAKPVVFDYTTGAAATLVETAGTCPTNTRFAVVWQGALWLFGDPTNANIIYASRIGDALDYDFSVAAADQGGAFVSTSSDTFGRLNGPVTAAMPHTTDAMVLSTLGGGLSVAFRHPRQGGFLTPISYNLYVLGQGAWCKAPDDTLFMLTPQGIATLDPSPNAVPTLLSKKKVPESLIGLDYAYENPKVAMAYESRWNGIIITVRGAQQQAWLYDLALGGFHPMEFTGYPYVLTEHPPFITESTSGVVFGGVSASFFDKFGTETIESNVIVGPVPVTDEPTTKARLTEFRTIFGRDTPKDGTGFLAISTGTDGQDALNRILSGTHQYETDLTSFSDNYGRCFPRLDGQSMAFEFSQTGGSLCIEDMAGVAHATGRNRGNRTDQIAVEGEATDFLAPSNIFDDTEWQGYSEATPAVPTCTLADNTLLLDLAQMPASWWAIPNADGGDIRVTNSDNVQVPCDVIDFDKIANTGLLALKMTQQNPPTPVRVWVGNVNAGLDAATATYGQYNAYDSNWKGFWPNAGFNDRTVNLNHLTMTNEVDETNLVTGPIGNQGLDYTFQDGTNNYGVSTVVPLTGVPVTLCIAASDPDTTATAAIGCRLSSGNGNLELTTFRSATLQSARAISTNSSGTGVTANSGTVANSEDWHHFAAVFASTTSRFGYLDGVPGNEGTTSNTAPTLDEIVIGKGSRSGLSSSSTSAELSLASVHNTARSTCWLAYQAGMLDQPTFWGTWSEFVEVNPAPEPDDPGGGDGGDEVGTWSGYAFSTPIAAIGTNQPDWVHWIDLSGMPTEWWSAVDSTGVDIRATDEANQFIPFDLIEFDSGANTGFATVRLSQTTTIGAMIKLWVGNGSAITVPANRTYGQYAVYDTYYAGFWPDGGGTDRTRFGNNMTAVGSPSIGGTTGPIGVNATTYDGSTQYSYVTASTIPNAPLTLSAVYKVSALNRTGAMVSINRSKFLGHSTIVVSPQTTPSQFIVRAYGDTVVSGSSEVEAVDNWHNTVGWASNNTIRGVTADDGALDSQSKRSIKTHDYTRISIGSRLSGSSTILWPFAGDICLVTASKKTRTLTNDWGEYMNAMLTQSTFYPDDWVWAAESNGLAQS